MNEKSPIGIFDSGYGGLTIMKEIVRLLPQYDYMYFGDNARAPYGNRSFEIVYEFTLQAVKYLFSKGCKLIILACNTASAKALRSIQQRDLAFIAPDRRVLGVIRPTVEYLGGITKSGHIGVLGTAGTIASKSYDLETAKLFPQFTIVGQACPLWVPLVENKEYDSPGADYFIDKYISELLARDKDIDSVILACTHYPLLRNKINQRMPKHIKIVEQGQIVAQSLDDYLQRHTELERQITKFASQQFLTTENPEKFNTMASVFLGRQVEATQISL